MEDPNGGSTNAEPESLSESDVPLTLQTHSKETKTAEPAGSLENQVQELKRKLKTSEAGLENARNWAAKADAAAGALEDKFVAAEETAKDALRKASELSKANEAAHRTADELKESERKAREQEIKVTVLQGNVKELTNLVQAKEDGKAELLQSLSSAEGRAADAEEKLKKLVDLYQTEKNASIKNEQKLEQQETKLRELEADLVETKKALEELKVGLKNAVQRAEDHEGTAKLHQNEANRLLEKSKELELFVETAKLKEDHAKDLVKSLQTELDDLTIKALSNANTEKTLKETQECVAKLEKSLSIEQAKAAELQQKLHTTAVKVSEHESTLSVHEKNADQFQNKIVHLEKALATSEEILRHKEDTIISLQIDIKEAKVSILEKEESLKELELRSSELQKNLQKWKNDAQSRNQDLEERLIYSTAKAKELEESVSHFQAQAKGTDEKLAEVEQLLQSSMEMQADQQKNLKTIEEAASQHQEKAKISSKRAVELEDTLASMRIQAKDAFKRGDELEEKLKAAEERCTYHENAGKELRNKVLEHEQRLEMSHRKEEELKENLKAGQELFAEHKIHAQHLSARSLELEELHKASAMKMTDMELLLKGAQVKHLDLESNLKHMEQKVAHYESNEKQLTDKLHELDHLVVVSKAKVKESSDKSSFAERLLSDLQEIHKNTEAEAKDLKEQLLFFQEQLKEQKAVNETREQEKQEFAFQLETAKKSSIEFRTKFEKEMQQLPSQEQVQELKETIKSLDHRLKLEQEEKLNLQKVSKDLQEADMKKTDLIAELKSEVQKLNESEHTSSIESIAARELDGDSFSHIGKLRKRKGKSEDSVSTSEVENHDINLKRRESTASSNHQLLWVVFSISVAAFFFGVWTTRKIYL
ncbi:hypothetical protein O6H91_02G078900 [Diphasiastrum complanatum]|uniref:Uncharacterized protein n=6 Tax=Diphasiastrum complanatum TaxID=34168 RepID=A0ACC2EHR2_DIPCM|nr:hypothetical protein O6H91_02G078900 [Diphasiastrum complanatum]KAJ7565874.1 hypothetical protein O6H91_02G078900 [Diphasiastrum complanatum]KAJ7565875.1 hypothetical protein O6H91_02G078900 [Diphasiastrum complanatum]KAJ7565876.1 hypothetical protein O6H91_02G078900 [Diphasiastrum complanatum]KAJ7565877.1 hypothetical protein O6H91_02G078900 [Diphasiastrum complanatum]